MDDEPDVSNGATAAIAEGSQSISVTGLPHLVIMKIFKYLTITEKLRSERVSKRWQDFVNASLRCHDILSKEQVYVKGLDNGQLRDILTTLLIRMSDSATKTNSLRRISLRQLSDFSADLDLNFPKLEHLDLMMISSSPCFYGHSLSSYLPPSVITGCKNLRSFSSHSVSPQILSLLLTECPLLKKLDIQIHIQQDLYDALQDPDEGMSVETSFFEDAKCSLEYLRINFLPGDAIPNLVKSCPGLKELRFLSEDITDDMFFDFCPLQNLPLRVLKLKDMAFSESETLDIYAMLSSDASLSQSLEEFTAIPSFGILRANLQLLQSLSNCRQLRVLHISFAYNRRSMVDTFETYVSDEDTHAYLSFWSIFTPENFPCLVHLRLPCLDLEGVVSDVTFHLPLLTNLSFCACDRLSDSDIAKLAGSVIRNSPSLDKLHLRERGFDDELFLALKEELPKICPNKFLVDSGFMDQPGLMPRPTYTMPLKDVCYGVTHYLETHARSFDLNLKFALPEDDCCSRLSDSTVECEYH